MMFMILFSILIQYFYLFLFCTADLGKVHYDAYQIAMGLGDRARAKFHLLIAHNLANLSQGRVSSMSSLENLARAPMNNPHGGGGGGGGGG